MTTNLIDLLKATNWEALKAKYKAYTTHGKAGVYNDNNGANSDSELLQDMRKLKTYISNILKKEFKGLLTFKINAKTSQHWGISDSISVTVTAPQSEMCKTFQELERDGNVHASLARFREYAEYVQTHGTIDMEKVNAYYKNYASLGNVRPQHLKNDYAKLYDFIDELLGSFSYNHSDIMTDYIDNGLSYKVIFQTKEPKDEEARKVFD